MSIPIVYDRYFDRATAFRGQDLLVTIVVSFVSPPAPSADTWFSNCGDNLGWPLLGGSPTVTLTNVYPEKVETTHQSGCVRFWPRGSSWTEPATRLDQVWTPIAPNTLTKVKVELPVKVALDATVGTVIGPPATWIAPLMTDFFPSRVMMAHGSDLAKVIASGTVPPGCSRSLTIV